MQLTPPETDGAERSDETTVDSDTPDVEPSQEEPDLPLDVVFDLLSNERRRRVLRFLLHESDETTLGELAEHIASIENDKPVRELSSSERKRVYICLYQCHLPKLDDANVVDFDEHRKSVEIAPGITRIQAYLASDEESQTTEPDSTYYFGFTALGASAFALHQMVFPATWVSGLILGALLTVICVGATQHLRRADWSASAR